MLFLKIFLYWILISLIFATPQINLYYTDIGNENVLQHNCLGIVPYYAELRGYREIISYCLSELPSTLHVEESVSISKYTFDELANQNITSEQLYHWSAPIETIENYQFYLNQLNTTNDLSLAKQIVYNCTMPRFGLQCQYELYYHDPINLSLNEIIQRFYKTYKPSRAMTCYIHLTCNRNSYESCLDWSEICDGHIDCLNNAIDEEHCWQFEINECQADERRCVNGQCIPRSFHYDKLGTPDCADASDEKLVAQRPGSFCRSFDEASIICEDVTCNGAHISNYCLDKKSNLPIKAIDTNRDKSLSDDCWSALKCIIENSQSTCQRIVQDSCPDMIYFPSIKGLIGEIYFAYTRNDLQNSIDLSLYICYKNSRYDVDFVNISKIFVDHMTCINTKQFYDQVYPPTDIYELLKPLRKYQLFYNYTSEICNQTNMYRCMNSLKCISIHRLLDLEYDCPYMDDENLTIIIHRNFIQYLNKSHWKCSISDKYIPLVFIRNDKCECGLNEENFCEDEDDRNSYVKNTILFQYICDGFTDLLPIMIDGKYHTDETECQQWECDNIYTHCDNVWNCPNARDEIDCDFETKFNCSSQFHLCVSIQTKQLMCLPTEKISDGKVDCFGVTDEPTLYEKAIQSKPFYDIRTPVFYCRSQRPNQSSIPTKYLCDGYNDCENGDDEEFCTSISPTGKGQGICSQDQHDYIFSDVEQFSCKYRPPFRFWYFKFFKMPYEILSIEKSMNAEISEKTLLSFNDQHQPHCNRGLDLRVWSNKDACLCPSSYYGDRCQYQNQRISLTIRFRAPAYSWQKIFTIIISLIDDSNQRLIHSYEQITYLSRKYCQKKFNLYLLYANRPKDPSKNYGIHIDFFEKLSLKYHGSVYLPVRFPFLPVHRLALIVNIPLIDQNNDRWCSNKKCRHGQCIKYTNHSENLSFCRCDEGWSGKYCDVPYTCTCSSDSLCLGISANNRSICICPVNKFGPRCLLTDRICQLNDNSTCQNDGQCVSNVNYKISNREFFCLCPNGFSGDRCEIINTKLDLSFDKDISLSHDIFIHFIEILSQTESIELTIHSTIFRANPAQNSSITIYWSQPFHLVFTELFNKTYYLTVAQPIYNRSAIFMKMLRSSDRCLHISELFNRTFVHLHLLRRIKYYHLPCQNQSLNLSCFYDDVHFCLCYEYYGKRLANCFRFNHQMKFDCYGQGHCENNAQCFQDHPTCPHTFFCLCPSCYFGRRCQFYTSGFGLSLDVILGYQILPNIHLNQQPFIVRMSLSLTIIFLLVGILNSILSMIVFKKKVVCEVGCGLYLLCSLIVTLLIIILFGLKFFILLFSQMMMITDRVFLSIQCYSLDFLLRICLCMDQWLNTCVAIERVVTSIQGPNFIKKKSKQTAKWIITILFIFVIATCIHEPFYRSLIDDNNEIDNIKRVWCITTYSSFVKTYNSTIQTFHFSGPFLLNILSVLILIKLRTRRRTLVHPLQKYREQLRIQFHQHRHLLIAPIVLILLALPRLILTFASKCMQSANDAWLFLIGYFISFIPSMVTFIIYILPSKFYLKEFRKSIVRYRKTLQQWLNLI